MRKSGVLLHISSLPGGHGIGCMGAPARQFVDFLARSRQSLWQVLPVGPTGFGDSPYQSFSSFAGNPYFIDLDALCESGLLRREEFDGLFENGDRVDYGTLYLKRGAVFEKVFARFKKSPPTDYESFCAANEQWLEPYALFMGIKEQYGGGGLDSWDEGVRLRRPEALATLSVGCRERAQYHKMLQYLFYSQWARLKAYANEKGIKIIGDLPIYAAADSADVWANPRYFALDSHGLPSQIAGCPPDCFSADGQLWGNPVYNWDALKADGRDWWARRLRSAFKMFDSVRIDHFRGFEGYYCIPRGESAVDGEWRRGPGLEFFTALKDSVGELKLIAEDLGNITDSVRQLRRECGFPGMRVLQFAFDSDDYNEHLPHNIPADCVVYTGTHDNDTLAGWQQSLCSQKLERAKRLFGVSDSGLCDAMMTAASLCKAETAVFTAQDLLGLGSEARMNTPSTLGGNWQWRLLDGQLTDEVSDRLAQLTLCGGRGN